MNKKEMLEKKVWAVLGVTPNESKFGYKIYKKLKDHDYKVYPINPKYDEINGEKCYKSIEELPETPDVLDFVVPPQVSLNALDEVNKKGIKNVWFQPGTSDKNVIEKAKESNLNIVEDCVLVALS
ncbi:CoA-binding protein [Senegalia massiliensis]|uniref:CoA-binding protein n=1 Tax=Senegalia massiliensis TaxID=1720316 RepID=A0A845QZM8_9CLOT|nr:CoA-binding protein [Senegalia massiliensis]NBI06956.1 CoA-binding protein [Senegalia massiliensis]